MTTDLVLSLLLDRQGCLVGGHASGGLNRFDRNSGRFTTYRVGPDRRAEVRQLDHSRTGRESCGWRPSAVSAGSTPGRSSSRCYAHDARDPRSISNDEVWAVHEDRQGRLWIGTSGGLNELDRTRGTFTNITPKDGLAGNAVRAILEDGAGYLWLATDGGLSRFHPPTRTFRNFTESDGLPGNLLNPYGLQGTWQSPAGEMVLGSTNGLTTFFPDRLSPSPYVPPVVLTELQLFNKPVSPAQDSPLQKPIWATDSLTLTHTQSIFTLEFAGLSYAAPEKNRYRYRLEGLESEWNEVDSRRRQATYTSLPAGRYVFRVQASNKDGVWNEKGVTLALTVLPPWWATWWFRSLMGLAFVGLIFGGYKVRVRELERREKRLDALVQQRTAELRATSQNSLQPMRSSKLPWRKRKRRVAVSSRSPTTCPVSCLSSKKCATAPRGRPSSAVAWKR